MIHEKKKVENLKKIVLTEREMQKFYIMSNKFSLKLFEQKFLI